MYLNTQHFIDVVMGYIYTTKSNIPPKFKYTKMGLTENRHPFSY